MSDTGDRPGRHHQVRQAYQLQGGMVTPSTPQRALEMIDVNVKGGQFPLVGNLPGTTGRHRVRSARYVPDR